MRDTGKMREYRTHRALAPLFSVMPRREATGNLSMSSSEISHFVRNDNREAGAVMRNRSKRGNPLGNEDGIALVTALMLGLFGMLMVAALLLMVNTGTWMSGSQKRYQTALAAAYGGNDFFVREILPQNVGASALTVGAYAGGLSFTNPSVGLLTKLTTAGQITDGIYPNNDPDGTITFPPLADLPTQPPITVNATVVGTIMGNASAVSGNGGGLEFGGVTDTGSGGGLGQLHIPWLFQTRANGNANTGRTDSERARLGSLYVH